MVDWIRDNEAVISVLINLGMLIVWVVYLQLFLASYRRQTQPKILINVGAGRRLDARCLLANMSSDAIYVQSLFATVEAHDRRWSSPVTDVEELTQGQQPEELATMTRQGPLMPGAVMDAGSFRDLIGRVLSDAEPPVEGQDGLPARLTALEIQAVADFGSDDLLVGARRRFDIANRDGHWALVPHTPYTEQIRSRRERRQIRRMLAETP